MGAILANEQCDPRMAEMPSHPWKRKKAASPSTHHYPMPILALIAAMLRMKKRRAEQLRLKLEDR